MLSKRIIRIAALSTAVIALAATSGGALAQKKYDTGATDTEIKIGNIMPYSGPAMPSRKGARVAGHNTSV